MPPRSFISEIGSGSDVAAVARLPHVEELNIGYAIVAHALTVGVEAAVRAMKTAIEEATL